MDFLTLLLHDIIQLIAWLVEFPLSQAIQNPILALIIFWCLSTWLRKLRPMEQLTENIKEIEEEKSTPTRKKYNNAKKEDKKPAPKREARIEEPPPIKEDTYPQNNSDEYCPF